VTRRSSTSSAERTRLDALVVARGLARTRAEAARLILAGRVRLADGAAAKAGRVVPGDAPVELAGPAPFVSRGGEKLAAALAAFGVVVRDRVCLDAGASTGGFTDCLLQAGARRVYAVDVGHGQLDARLRADPRVVVRDGVNARYLTPEGLGEPVTLATVDVSFISLTKVLSALARCLIRPADVRGQATPGSGGSSGAPETMIVALVKPQFEVGRRQVGKGGVVRDPALHAAAVQTVAGAARALGLRAVGVVASPLRGPKGNREFFLHLVARVPGEAPGPEADAAEAARLAAAVVRAVGAAATEPVPPREGAGP
jgi:23S rRNA (cytidine1920-2'-O)/16S rRNA (cytidine1409-2'-O)-methyltransferase